VSDVAWLFRGAPWGSKGGDVTPGALKDEGRATRLPPAGTLAVPSDGRPVKEQPCHCGCVSTTVSRSARHCAAFKKLLERSGLTKELRKRKYYEKPCEARRRSKLRKLSAIRKGLMKAGDKSRR
jgi:small subunit ribosomal protein S21